MQVNTKKIKRRAPTEVGAKEKMANRIESLKNYIEEQIAKKRFDENGDIRIDFADLGTEEETIQAVAELGYIAEPAGGQGVWWISK